MKFKILLLLFLICIVSVLFGYLYICYSIEHFDTTPVLPLKAYYINLDSRVDRKNEFENGIAPHKDTIKYERFPAIKHEKGALGCSKSNLEVIRTAKKNNDKYVIVFEDDFEFIVSPEVFQKEITKLLDETKVKFDVCLLAYNTKNLYDCEYPFLYKIRDAQTTAGYLVCSHYYDTLIDTWEKAVELFEQTGDEAKYTCDQSWKPLQEKDNWYCFKQRIGKQRAGYSDIVGGAVNYECFTSL